MIPVMPFLVIKLKGTPTSLGFLMATYSIMQFIFAPIWGRVSDRIGRRPVLLIGLAGYGLTFILFGVATQLWMLFVIRIVSGAVSSATLPTAMAYIADITGHENRAAGMGMMGAAMGLGMVFGPALGGWLGHYGFHLPFFAAGGLALLTLPFAFFLLKESLPAHSELEPGSSLRFDLSIINDPLFPLIALAFAVSFSMALFESTFALFAADRVGFGPKDMGLLFAFLGVIGSVVQAGLISRLVKAIGDSGIIISGMVISIIGLLLLLIAPNRSLIIAFTGVFTVGNSLLRPSISAFVTKVASGGQGATLGLTQSSDSLGRVFGPVAGGWLFEFDIVYPYLAGACVLTIVLAATKSALRGYVPLEQDTDAAS